MKRSGIDLAVNRELCIGSGSCSFHAERTFDLDDEMKVVLLAGGDSAAAVAAAVDSCPSGALTRGTPAS